MAVLAALVATHVPAFGALSRHVPCSSTTITPYCRARLRQVPGERFQREISRIFATLQREQLRVALTAQEHSGRPRLAAFGPQTAIAIAGAIAWHPTPCRRSCCTLAAASTAQRCARAARIACTPSSRRCMILLIPRRAVRDRQARALLRLAAPLEDSSIKRRIQPVAGRFQGLADVDGRAKWQLPAPGHHTAMCNLGMLSARVIEQSTCFAQETDWGDGGVRLKRERESGEWIEGGHG